jgi:hypothetical protein
MKRSHPQPLRTITRVQVDMFVGVPAAVRHISNDHIVGSHPNHKKLWLNDTSMPHIVISHHPWGRANWATLP